MTEKATISPYLSDGLANGFKIILDWFNSDSSGQLCTSDFNYFQKNHGLSHAMIVSLLHALTEKKCLKQVVEAVRIREGKKVLYLVGQDEDVWTLGEFAFEFAYENNMVLVGSAQIPVSDRFVELDHNSKEFKETISKLEQIEERVQKSNDLIADINQRLAIIREVKTLRESLNEKVVRTGSILASTRNSGILISLSQHCSDAVLNALAVEAIAHILKLFGMS